MPADSAPLGIQPTAIKKYGPNVYAQVKKLADEPLERVIERLTTHDKYSDKKAREARIEFLQFFSLFFVTKSRVNFPKQADAFLHSFLLFSKDYDRFCQRHFDKFIHHNPIDSKNGPDLKAQSRSIKLFKELYGVDLIANGQLGLKPECNEGGTGACHPD